MSFIFLCRCGLTRQDGGMWHTLSCFPVFLCSPWHFAQSAEFEFSALHTTKVSPVSWQITGNRSSSVRLLTVVPSLSGASGPITAVPTPTDGSLAHPRIMPYVDDCWRNILSVDFFLVLHSELEHKHVISVQLEALWKQRPPMIKLSVLIQGLQGIWTFWTHRYISMYVGSCFRCHLVPF